MPNKPTTQPFEPKRKRLNKLAYSPAIRQKKHRQARIIPLAPSQEQLLKRNLRQAYHLLPHYMNLQQREQGWSQEPITKEEYEYFFWMMMAMLFQCARYREAISTPNQMAA